MEKIYVREKEAVIHSLKACKGGEFHLYTELYT